MFELIEAPTKKNEELAFLKCKKKLLRKISKTVFKNKTYIQSQYCREKFKKRFVNINNKKIIQKMHGFES